MRILPKKKLFEWKDKIIIILKKKLYQIIQKKGNIYILVCVCNK